MVAAVTGSAGSSPPPPPAPMGSVPLDATEVQPDIARAASDVSVFDEGRVEDLQILLACGAFHTARGCANCPLSSLPRDVVDLLLRKVAEAYWETRSTNGLVTPPTFPSSGPPAPPLPIQQKRTFEHTARACRPVSERALSFSSVTCGKKPPRLLAFHSSPVSSEFWGDFPSELLQLPDATAGNGNANMSTILEK